MQFLKTLWAWIISSSVNANKWSLTVKGLLGVAIVWVTYFFGFSHIPFDNTQLQAVIDGIIALIQALGLVATTIVTLVGAIRKVYTTANGTNAVISQQ